MPKKVDRQERRTRIADALMRVAADQGLEAVSLRHVAAEAGVSAGMVQHYFRTTASAALREETGQMVGFIASLLPVPEKEIAARSLLALMEGLGVYLLGGQYSPAEARAALDAQLDLIFDGAVTM